jgi:hypothetical protein
LEATSLKSASPLQAVDGKRKAQEEVQHSLGSTHHNIYCKVIEEEPLLW